MPAQEDSPSGIRGALCGLFPAAPAAALPVSWRSRVPVTVAAVAAVVLGAAVLLLRIPGLPAWDSIYAEDYSEFLLGALRHPWHLFAQYNGYEQLLPRVVAQLVAYLPLAYAAKVFACCGALTAAGCALFIFHASAGHIRSVTLRVVLGAAVLLLPVAPLEIADSTVDAPWYLLLALFWAVLWRPQTRGGTALAAVVGFVTAASNSIAILFAPLLAIRVFALRHTRDHGVTAGWLAGCLVQVPLMVAAAVSGQSRLFGGLNPGDGQDDRLDSLTFYVHDVVLRSLGWHLSWWLESRTTTDWATFLAALALAAVLGLIMVAQPATRPFIVLALLTGFIVTVVSASLTPWGLGSPVTLSSEVEARYTVLPIFLIEAALIVGVDHVLRRRRELPARPATSLRPVLTAVRPAVAVTVLAAFLAVSWVADFRYQGARSVPSAHPWSPIVAELRDSCDLSPTGNFTLIALGGPWTIPCARLRF